MTNDSDHSVPEGAGTVIAGTLRPEDLIPAFVEALDARIEARTFEPGADDPLRVQAVDGLQSQLGDLERRSKVPGYFDSDEATWDIDWLQDALEEYAPEGCRFGAHEGDGADFGFWPVEDDDG